MEKNKYFTPDIEDIRIGYEFEYNGHFKHLPPQEWKKIVMDYEFFTEGGGWDNEPMSMYYLPIIKRYTEPDNIRVSYLTKEQIEAEGWKEIHDEEYIKEIKSVKDSPKEVWWFNNNSNNNYQSTFEFRYRGNHQVKFQGECKSINEFRWICKLLKI